MSNLQTEQIVKCIKGCWDGTNCIEYIKGDEAKIHPESSLAQYFSGWAPGTKVKRKIKYRDENGDPRVKVELVEVPGKKESEEEDCPWCHKTFKNLGAHIGHCKDNPENAEET